MALSPWLQPSAINSPLQAAGSLGFGDYNNSGDLDKRNDRTYEVAGLIKASGPTATRQAINTAKTMAETITNALGNRSPYYIIGEIPWSSDNSWWGRHIEDVTKFLGGFGGAVRAVSDLFTGKKQEGVIIDCLGDVNGEISVEFTSNPVLFTGSRIANGRMRKPNVVTAVVAVSNYNNDDVVGMAIDTISALDPTGLVGNTMNLLLEDGNTRAQNALYKLRGLQENGEPFKVYTPHGMYENMLIKSIKPLTNASSMDMLLASIVFEEIIFAQPYYTDAEEATASPARENVITPQKGNLWERTGSIGSKAWDKITNLF